jgi:hypothetical protein
MPKKKANLSCYTETTPSDPATTPQEALIHARCFQMAWNEYPQTRRLFAYNLNNSANRIAGARNKALGLIKGRADTELLWNGRLHYAEFKTATGRQDSAQLQFEATVTAHGATYTIIRTTEEFRTWIERILNA